MGLFTVNLAIKGDLKLVVGSGSFDVEGRSVWRIRKLFILED